MSGFVGIREVVVLVIAVALVFGVKRLPEVGRSVGRSVREFKDGITGRRDDQQRALARE